MNPPRTTAQGAVHDVDVVIVGAGFGGLYALHRMRGLGLTCRVLEAGSGVGGTWFWNRYPGARCDVESLEYSYSFDARLQQEWEWTERYAAQPEILAYIDDVAERFDLLPDVSLETRVVGTTFDEMASGWTVDTDRGDRVRCRFVIAATGCLSTANTPEIAGSDTFEGTTLHTGHWPEEGVELSGKRVGIIGTGSSAVQAIPVIAEEAGRLTVFQRTPQYTIPARNGPLDPGEQAEVKAGYEEFRAENQKMANAFAAKYPSNRINAGDVSDADREAEFELRWERGGTPFLGAFRDLVFDLDANQHAAEFVRGKIADIVQDREIAAKLTPWHPSAASGW